MQETRDRSLGQEDPLEKEMATPPVFLPGGSHGWKSLVSYSPRVAQSPTRLSDFTFLYLIWKLYSKSNYQKEQNEYNRQNLGCRKLSRTNFLLQIICKETILHLMIGRKNNLFSHRKIAKDEKGRKPTDTIRLKEA